MRFPPTPILAANTPSGLFCLTPPHPPRRRPATIGGAANGLLSDIPLREIDAAGHCSLGRSLHPKFPAGFFYADSVRVSWRQ